MDKPIIEYCKHKITEEHYEVDKKYWNDREEIMNALIDVRNYEAEGNVWVGYITSMYLLERGFFSIVITRRFD